MNRHPAHYIGPATLIAAGLVILFPATLMLIHVTALLVEGTSFELRGPVLALALPVAASFAFWYGGYRWWRQPDK